MILNIKVKDEDDLKLDTNNIKDEEFSIYTYSEKQLKSICKTLFDIIGNNEISTEDEKECQETITIIQNALYIIARINIKHLDSYYLKTLDNENLIKYRNDIIKLLNQHIILYEETQLPLYSKMIDFCSAALMALKKEFEKRKLNNVITRNDKKQIKESLNISNLKYPIGSFISIR